MDLTATMLDAAQTDYFDARLDGTSLFSIMKDSEAFDARNLYWRSSTMKALRKKNWKYVVDGHSQLLFDLDADIGERTNRFHKNPEKVNELKRALEDWEGVKD